MVARGPAHRDMAKPLLPLSRLRAAPTWKTDSDLRASSPSGADRPFSDLPGILLVERSQHASRIVDQIEQPAGPSRPLLWSLSLRERRSRRELVLEVDRQSASQESTELSAQDSSRQWRPHEAGRLAGRRDDGAAHALGPRRHRAPSRHPRRRAAEQRSAERWRSRSAAGRWRTTRAPHRRDPAHRTPGRPATARTSKGRPWTSARRASRGRRG
jgi:hypothetical protein